MSADPTSGSKGDSSVALKHKLHEIILVDKPRHLVDQKEDLERLFPRCPPNTLESVAKVNKKNKRRNLNTLNNNCQLEAGKESLNQVGKIIDLDFNSNNDAKVNEQNRRYHQQVSSLRGGAGVLSPTTSDSTKSTPAKRPTNMSTTCSSSSSSTSSTKGSSPDDKIHSTSNHQARNVNKSTSSFDMESTMAAAIPSGTLRDTKIEIAGGREVYHQSRVKSSRHRMGSKHQRFSGSDFVPQATHVMVNKESSDVSSGAKRKSSGYLYETHFYEQDQTSSQTTRPFIKETVFSSEIHSIEYQDPIRKNMVYETDFGEESEIVFDDIGDSALSGRCDVNVTYDLLQGEFPPPTLCGLSVKLEDDEDQEDLLTSQKPYGATSSIGQSLDNLCLGAEAMSTTESLQPISEPVQIASSRTIGGITIAEYDGSPKRYRPRGSNETASNASSCSDVSRTSAKSSGVKVHSNSTRHHGMKLPGFPQRILPSASEQPSSSSSSPGMSKKETTQLQATQVVEEEELLKFEDIPPPIGSTPLPPTQMILSSHNDILTSTFKPKMTDFDLRFEFSETRKVLEEFFPPNCKPCLSSMTTEDLFSKSDKGKEFNELEYTLRRRSPAPDEHAARNSYIGQRLATDEGPNVPSSPTSNQSGLMGGFSNQDLLSMCTIGDQFMGDKGFTGLTTMVGQTRLNVEPATVCHNVEEDQKLQPLAGIQISSGNHVTMNDFTLSPEMTDCDSADLESEISLNEGSYHSSGPKMHTSMPVLEDGLSSGHASDLEEDAVYSSSGSVMLKKQQLQQQNLVPATATIQNLLYGSQKRSVNPVTSEDMGTPNRNGKIASTTQKMQHYQKAQPQMVDALTTSGMSTIESSSTLDGENNEPASVAAALKDIKMAIQATRVLSQLPQPKVQPQLPSSATSIRNNLTSISTLTTTTTTTSSMVLQHQIDDPWVRQTTSFRGPQTISLTPSSIAMNNPPTITQVNEDSVRQTGENLEEDDDDEIEDLEEDNDLAEDDDDTESDIGEERVPTPKTSKDAEDDLDTDQETDRLLGQQYNDDNGYYDAKNEAAKKKGTKTKEAVTDPKVLIEGVLFRARYLGSTQLVCEGQPTKATRMMQAEEAVSRIKALTSDGDSQPSTEVDLFISTEKIMVLNTDLKEIMMDHALRTISYIADIGDLLVIMARRRPAPTDDVQVIGTTPKMICHVFESVEAQFIAQSIGQAFQVAYVEFLKANGIEDSSFVKEMDYQEVLNSQEIFNNELALFSSKERQKEVVVPKAKGEILGVVIVESGWGSMLPTIVLANLAPGGPAARCGQLNIGDQVIAINGISLVGLPLSTCQHYIKNAKNKTAVKLTAVSCAPVVEVKIKRPDTKYQLGFSVQNGVICSLLRGGIAERGGVRVGHRIIEINGQSVVAVPHEKIVNLLATSVGEITMKTMPTSMFRLLTGQESPLYI